MKHLLAPLLALALIVALPAFAQMSEDAGQAGPGSNEVKAPDDDPAAKTQRKKKGPAADAVILPANYYDLPEFQVGLLGQTTPRVMRTHAVFELGNATQVPLMKAYQNQITSALESGIARYGSEDIDDPDTVNQLRNDLLIKVRQIAKNIEIKNLLFVKLVVR